MNTSLNNETDNKSLLCDRVHDKLFSHLQLQYPRGTTNTADGITQAQSVLENTSRGARDIGRFIVGTHDFCKMHSKTYA